MPNQTPIAIQCSINGELSQVWNYWTDPSYITNWYFASEDWHCPNAENDLRKDGRFRIVMAAKDGSFGFDFEGTYLEVISQSVIEYILEDDRKVLTTFEKTGEGILVRQVFDPEHENPVEIQKGGWQSILNNFKKYVESH